MCQITKRIVLTDKEDNIDMDDMTILESMQIYDNPIDIYNYIPFLFHSSGGRSAESLKT